MLIQKADYGRMTVGRCINRNYYIGCSANVMEQVHKRCSLRRTCKISVPDHSLLRNSACPKDLVAFLSVKYACIKVLDTLTSQCSHKGQAFFNLEPVIYITDGDLNDIRASGISCKIVISAKPGQFIRVTLHEMWSHDAGSSSHWLRTRKRRRSSSTEDNLEHLIGHRQQPIRNNGIRAGHQRQLNTSGNNSNMSTVTKSLTSPTSTTSATRRRATHTTVEHKMKRSNHIASPPESQVKVQQCIPVALIAETTNPDQKHPVCRGGSRLPHATVVYTSSGSSLQLIPFLDDLMLTTGSDDSMREENLREAIGEGDDDDDDDDDGDRDQVKRYGDFLMSFQAYSCPDLELTLGMSFKVNRKGDQADVVCPSSQDIWSLSCVNDTWIGELGRCDEERSFASTFENFEFHWRSAYGGWFVATVCIALGGVLSVGLIGVVISQRRRNCYKLFPPKSSSSSSSSSAHHLKQQKHQRKSGQGSINRGDLIHCNLIGCPLDQSRVEPDHGSDLHLCTDPLFCTNDSLFCHPDPVFCDPRRPQEAEVKFCEDCQKRLTEQNVNKLSPSCRVCRFSFDASTTE